MPPPTIYPPKCDRVVGVGVVGVGVVGVLGVGVVGGVVLSIF